MTEEEAKDSFGQQISPLSNTNDEIEKQSAHSDTTQDDIMNPKKLFAVWGQSSSRRMSADGGRRIVEQVDVFGA